MLRHEYYLCKQHFFYIAFYKHEFYGLCVYDRFHIRISKACRLHHHVSISSYCTIGTIEGGTRSIINVARTSALRAFFNRMVVMLQVRARPRVEALNETSSLVSVQEQRHTVASDSVQIWHIFVCHLTSDATGPTMNTTPERVRLYNLDDCSFTCGMHVRGSHCLYYLLVLFGLLLL